MEQIRTLLLVTSEHLANNLARLAKTWGCFGRSLASFNVLSYLPAMSSTGIKRMSQHTSAGHTPKWSTPGERQQDVLPVLLRL